KAHMRFERTSLLTRFNKITDIRGEVYEHGEHVSYTLRRSQINLLRSLLDDGVRDPNAVKRDCNIVLFIDADGQQYRWPALIISYDEVAVLVNNEECWRGIDKNKLLEIVETRDSPHQQTR